ncbi:MAG: hypothetical protein H7A46_14340 [Verrucomicrobiales bacterium]|nr:hypothetical protein [Verrucomicrobiales bacterium]
MIGITEIARSLFCGGAFAAFGMLACMLAGAREVRAALPATDYNQYPLQSANGDYVNINGAYWWAKANLEKAGSGQYVDFVGIQDKPNDSTGTPGVAEGYNTSGALVYDQQSGVHTRGVWMSELQITTSVSGQRFYAFTFDPHDSDDRISIDEFSIYLKSPEPDLVIDNSSKTSFPGYEQAALGDGLSLTTGLGLKIYGLNPTTSDTVKNTVLLDSGGGGSGNADLAVLVPVDLFTSALGGLDPKNLSVYIYIEPVPEVGCNGWVRI